MTRAAKRLALCVAALLVLAACALAPEAGAPQTPTLVLKQGELRGRAVDGVEAFYNIPFAAAPVGALRWRAPESAPAWGGVRDATSPGPACPQPMRPAVVAGGVAEHQSEDCLQLNIWRPAGAAGLPVMVWIHGGAHVIGSGVFPAFNGAALARDGVIVVTINYRLGPLGYFAHPALSAEAARRGARVANFGLYDQLAALGWVQDNIAAFGGDPDRVTIFGESAGGMAVATLLTTREASGLFSAAIIQSGVNLYEPNTLAQQEAYGAALAARLGLGDNAAAEDLRAVSAQRLIEAAGARSGGGVNPVIDGQLVLEAPWRAFAQNRAIDVPLLLGANSNEASIVLALGVGPEAALAYAGANEAARDAYGLAPEHPEFTRQVLGDAWFVAPARWLAAQASSGAPAYLYHFDYVAADRRDAAPGAAHGSDVPYVFQTLDYLQTLAGPMTEEDRAFARGVSACWAAFARTHRPDCALAPDWPAYDSASDTLMLLAPRTRLVSHFRQPQLDLLLARRFPLAQP